MFLERDLAFIFLLLPFTCSDHQVIFREPAHWLVSWRFTIWSSPNGSCSPTETGRQVPSSGVGWNRQKFLWQPWAFPVRSLRRLQSSRCGLELSEIMPVFVHETMLGLFNVRRGVHKLVCTQRLHLRWAEGGALLRRGFRGAWLEFAHGENLCFSSETNLVCSFEF